MDLDKNFNHQQNKKSMKNKNIITLPNGAPATPAPEQTQTTPTPPVKLTMSKINAIGGAYARLTELRAQSVLTPTLEAEVSGLIEFLSNEMLTHADEFIATWVVTHTEYQPILNLLATVSTRIGGIQQSRAQKANEPK